MLSDLSSISFHFEIIQAGPDYNIEARD